MDDVGRHDGFPSRWSRRRGAGYTWRTAATLAEPGFETDEVGGQRVPDRFGRARGRGLRAPPVHQPGTPVRPGRFPPPRSSPPAWCANSTRPSPWPTTTPAAGPASRRCWCSQSGASGLGRARLLVYDAATGRSDPRPRGRRADHLRRPGSAARSSRPDRGGLEEIDDSRRSRRTLAATQGPPYSLRPDADGRSGVLWRRTATPPAWPSTSERAGQRAGTRAADRSVSPRVPRAGLPAGRTHRTRHTAAQRWRLTAPARAQVTTRGEAVQAAWRRTPRAARSCRRDAVRPAGSAVRGDGAATDVTGRSSTHPHPGFGRHRAQPSGRPPAPRTGPVLDSAAPGETLGQPRTAAPPSAPTGVRDGLVGTR